MLGAADGKILKDNRGKVCVLRPSKFANHCSPNLAPTLLQRLGARGTTFLMITF